MMTLVVILMLLGDTLVLVSTWSIQATKLRAELGGESVLMCHVFHGQIEFIDWRINRQMWSAVFHDSMHKEDNARGPKYIFENRNVSGSFNEKKSTHQLRIHKTRSSDEGKYICDVILSKVSKPLSSPKVKLYLTVPPQGKPAIYFQNGTFITSDPCNSTNPVTIPFQVTPHVFSCLVNNTRPQSTITWDYEDVDSGGITIHKENRQDGTTETLPTNRPSVEREITVENTKAWTCWTCCTRVLTCFLRLPNPYTGYLKEKPLQICIKLEDATMKKHCYYSFSTPSYAAWLIGQVVCFIFLVGMFVVAYRENMKLPPSRFHQQYVDIIGCAIRYLMGAVVTGFCRYAIDQPQKEGEYFVVLVPIVFPILAVSFHLLRPPLVLLVLLGNTGSQDRTPPVQRSKYNENLVNIIKSVCGSPSMITICTRLYQQWRKGDHMGVTETDHLATEGEGKENNEDISNTEQNDDKRDSGLPGGWEQPPVGQDIHRDKQIIQVPDEDDDNSLRDSLLESSWDQTQEIEDVQTSEEKGPVAEGDDDNNDSLLESSWDEIQEMEEDVQKRVVQGKVADGGCKRRFPRLPRWYLTDLGKVAVAICLIIAVYVPWRTVKIEEGLLYMSWLREPMFLFYMYCVFHCVFSLLAYGFQWWLERRQMVIFLNDPSELSK